METSFEIYAVVKRYQGNDYDSWGHWIEEMIESYHSTKQKAEFAIKKELEKHKAWADGHDSIDQSVYDNIENNKVWLTTENNGYGGQYYDWYYVKSITVN